MNQEIIKQNINSFFYIYKYAFYNISLKKPKSFFVISMKSNLLESFEENGYVVVDNLIEKSLFDRLLVASDKVTTMARNGDWVLF